MDAVIGFEWDEGNASKVETRGFTVADVERAFLNGRGTYFPDLRHSGREERFWLIGITDDGRHITVPFTVRDELVRPVTASDNRAEIQEMGAMKKRQEEAAYLESQADRLEKFVDLQPSATGCIPEQAVDVACDATHAELAARRAQARG